MPDGRIPGRNFLARFQRGAAAHTGLVRALAGHIFMSASAYFPFSSGKRSIRRPSLLAIISYLVVAFFAFLAIYPLFLVLLRLVYSDGRFDPAPLLLMVTQPDVGRLLFNTIVVVGASSLLALIIGSIMAWINERTDAGMGLLSEALPLVPFLLPPIAGAIGWVLLLSDRAGLLNALFRKMLLPLGIEMKSGPFNIYSWTGLIFVYTVYAIPYVYLLVSAGLRNVDSSLEEQSRICGNGLWKTMWLVTIPAVRPSLGAALLLLVWFGFALYSVPAVIGTGAQIEVLPVRLVNLLSFTYPPETAQAIGLGMIVVLIVGGAWLLQTRILAGGRHATVGGKGHRMSRIELGRWRWAARSVVLAYILLAAVLPMIGLMLVTLNGFWTPNIKWGALSLATFREVLFEDAVTVTSLKNSILLGIIGATIGMAAAAIISLFVRERGRGVGRVVDGLIKLPASISTIVLAVGFVLAFSGPPFGLNGTFLILLLAYLALYLPQGSVAADAAAAQVGNELTEASSISGAGPTRTLLRVSLPLMLAGLVAGWALLFVRMIGDLTASAILAGTNNPVVGFRILEVYQGGSFATLAALSTVLTLVSAAIVVLMLVVTRRSDRSKTAIRAGG